MHILCPLCHYSIEVVNLHAHQEIVCPSCGSSFRLETDATTDPKSNLPQKLGRFELLGVLGHGAFGTVYKARDPELDRIVAVKVPRAGNLAGPQELDRFLREARSAAQLRHLSIVTIHEVGQKEGLPYLVSDFVQGVTLADLLSARRPGFRETAELVAAVADALHYAHEQGVVHRDVKPSNIMIGDDGRPCVMDFGLAKRDTGEITMTMEGQVLGTPAYMSPEQARVEGHMVDGRSDVYNLGVVFYQLLTGELPFRGTQRMLLHQVLHDEPRPPRSLNDRLPRDLETICLKAMAKEPGRRYATSRAMADDLQRFLHGEPIQARPVGVWERGWNWAKRRPAVAALLGVSSMAALALVGLVVGWVYSTRLEKSLQGTEQARGESEQARQDAVVQQQRAERALDQARLYQYYHHIALAHAGWQANDLVRMEPLLDDCPRERRHWEWRYMQRLLHGDLLTVPLHPSLVISVAFSPAGTQLAVSGLFGMVKVLDAASGREIHTLKGHPGDSQVWSVAFSPDGARLASAGTDGQIRIWDVASGRELLVFRAHDDRMYRVAFSPDGARLVSASYDRTVRVWDAATGRPVHVLKGHNLRVHGVAFSPHGAQLASASDDQTVKLWDTATGREIRTLRGHRAPVREVAFNPDGARLASASSDRTIIVWDPRTGQEVLTLTGHSGPVRSLAFSPEGNRLASAASDQTVRLWDLAMGREVLTPKGHTSEVLSVAFSPDGSRLASGSPDGTVKTWSTMLSQEARTLRGHADEVWGVAYSPDGKWIASGSYDRTVKLWDAITGQEVRTLRDHEGHVLKVAFSPRGHWLASTSEDRTVKLWETATGRLVHTLKGHVSPVSGVAFSPDETKLASASEDRTVRVWNVAAGHEQLKLQGHTDRVFGIAFSPDGKRLASGSDDTTARIWDVNTGKTLFELQGHDSTVEGVTYSHDGAWLATAGDDNVIRIWDTATGQPLSRLEGYPGSVWAVAFSPDDRRLASTSMDGTVRVWDTSTWREALTLRGHAGGTTSVAFSPDGERLVSSSSDGTVKVWDARPLGSEAAGEREALGLLDFLFARPLSKPDVLDYLKQAPTIRPEARKLALGLVDRYCEEKDPEAYHQASWAVGRQRYLSPFQYRFALRQAEVACQLAPQQGKFRLTLGAARYRIGDYPKALTALTEADGSPAALAFLAMTHHQLGHKDEARTVLANLRETIKLPQGARNAQTQTFVREAEALIGGPAPGGDK
jgi:WD40 repeat protein/tRNA A-37 threonylcarbamoyl transferase component Bud32